MAEKYISSKEVQKLLRVNQAEIDSLVKDGKLKAYIQKGEVKFREDEVVDYLRKKESEGREAPPPPPPAPAEQPPPAGEEVFEGAKLDDVGSAKVVAPPTAAPRVRIRKTERTVPEFLKKEKVPVSNAKFEEERSTVFTILLVLAIIFSLAAMGILLIPIQGLNPPQFLRPILDYLAKLG